jgi:transcriptional regulator with XRE-family HTH domain
VALRTEWLARKGLSQRQIAERVGVGRVTVWRWLEGRSAPGRRALTLLVAELGLSPTELAELVGVGHASS